MSGRDLQSTLPTEENQAQRLFDRAEFARWLEAQPPGHRFGKKANNCALAEYSGGDIGWLTYTVGTQDGHLPQWAIEFVDRFLRAGRPPFTVSKALAVLRSIP